MKPTKTYFTSDWHLFHERAIEMDNRPFRDLDHMHEVLVNNYNSTVGPDDVCYMLGDLGMGPVEPIREIIQALQGTKIYILGNHDRGANALYRMGFDVVQNAALIYVAGQPVTLSHCPLRGVWREDTTNMRNHREGDMWHGESRHVRYSIPDFGQFHLHGHIHSPNKGRSETVLGKQRDIAVPANNYRPVSISLIESWITKYKG